MRDKRTYTRKNGKVVLIDRFSSVNEFFSAIALAQPMNESHSRRTFDALNEDKEEFRGLTNENIMKYKLGYPEGIESLRMLPELNIRRGGVKYAYKWDDQDGDDMDMPRYFEGMACMRKRYKTAGDGQQGRFVEVKVKIDENGRVKYSSMLWKTYTACRIVDQLEAAGVRVRVVACDYSYMYANNAQYAALEVPVKQYNEPLNMALIASICSPWFFRYWVFKYAVTNFDINAYGLGTAMSLDEYFRGENKLREELQMTPRKDLILIDSGKCLSKDAADDFIKSLEI